MLSRITIQDLVIVRSLDLAFDAGMTALTGETGAGKSILIDALALALGDRTDNAMIRKGADKAQISVSFEIGENSPAARWIDDHDLGADGECLLRRVLVRDGRSRAYINGSPTTQAALRELGELLVDIHGQHAHQSLLKPVAQRQLLDEFAGLGSATRKVRQLYTTWQDSLRQLDALRTAGEDRANRLDYLRFQIAELDGLACEPEALETLEQEHGRLAHADRLLTETAALLSALDDEASSPGQVLSRAASTLTELSTLDERLGETRELLEGAAIQIDEAAANLRHYGDSLELDPQRLQQIDEQLGRLHDAARKHRVAPAELIDLLARLQSEEQQLDAADTTLVELEARSATDAAAYEKAAKVLSGKRVKAAGRLSKTVTQSMQTLSMKGGRFSIECTAEPKKPGADGIDQVCFLVAANPGQTEGPLGEIASGGELSRISLAIQVATADCGAVPCLIFDEVDVGIGGAVAEIVGQLLHSLGKERQVLCVTHLPQVASQADNHLRVQKSTDGRSTETQIDTLDRAHRIDEIARMLGGVDITEQTRRHASEMVQQVEASS